MTPALEAPKIVATLERLEARIAARFPQSGLLGVCGRTIETARATRDRAAAIGRPNLGLRLGVGALLGAGLIAQIWALRLVHVEQASFDAADVLQSLEAAVNLTLLFGGGVWFLLTLEAREKRRKVLDALHELRALAHVIDMHQLTKDPTIVLSGANATHASPARTMSEFELARYLDYCAEMLSLIGKMAALYTVRMRDPSVVEAVTDVENLTTNLGRKIWQKIMILSQLDERRAKG